MKYAISHRDLLLLACLTFSILPAKSHAEIYKWKDADGKVHFGDKKPEDITVESLVINGGDSGKEKRDAVDHAASVAPASSVPSTPVPGGLKPAVIMYVTKDCGYCNQTRQFLAFNNIQFIEYDIATDRSAAEKFYQLGGAEAPVILVGDTVIYGYNVPALVDALGITLE